MNTKHTPTPWTLRISGGPTATVIDANGEMVLPLGEIECGWTDTSTGSYVDPEPEVMVMERIVKCVNACEGLADPSVVPELLEALKKTRAALMCADAAGIPVDEELAQLDAAIAKATGETI